MSGKGTSSAVSSPALRSPAAIPALTAARTPTVLSLVKQDGIVDDLGAGFQHIAETDIDRQINPCSADRRRGAKPQTAIFKLFANAIDAKRILVRHHAIARVPGSLGKHTGPLTCPSSSWTINTGDSP
jgi:hypothetical protein